MTRQKLKRLLCFFALAASLGLTAGCKNYLAFATATKFGVDITQKPDQTIDVTMGYNRYEVASIPVAETPGEKGNVAQDADEEHDAYSVLGTFYVNYGNPWKGEGLQLKQFFATGMAARNAAQKPEMRAFFGDAAFKIQQKKKGDE